MVSLSLSSHQLSSNQRFIPISIFNSHLRCISLDSFLSFSYLFFLITGFEGSGTFAPTPKNNPKTQDPDQETQASQNHRQSHQFQTFFKWVALFSPNHYLQNHCSSNTSSHQRPFQGPLLLQMDPAKGFLPHPRILLHHARNPWSREEPQCGQKLPLFH